MDLTLKDLELSFDRFDAMQGEHMEAISSIAKQPPDISKLSFQRSRAFEELKNHLNVLAMEKVNKDNVRSGDAGLWPDRLEKIIQKEKIIAGMLEQYREELMQKKHKMLQGKKALKGYGSACCSF